MKRRLNKTGFQLIVDGFSSPEILRNARTLNRLLIDIPILTKMSVLDRKIYMVPEDETALKQTDFKDSGGLTGFAVLTTSHISIHTFPLTSEFRFDVYSCKPFDYDKVKEMVVNTLKAKDIHTFVLER